MTEAKEPVVSPTPSEPPSEAALVSDGVDGIRTTRLLERAVRSRWPIPEKYKEAIIKRQVAIAVDAKSKPREASAAARTILAADKLNQADEHEANKEPEQHIHLHQQVPSSVNLDKLTDEQLNNLEQLLLAASPTTTNDSGSTDTAG